MKPQYNMFEFEDNVVNCPQKQTENEIVLSGEQQTTLKIMETSNRKL